MDKLAALKDIHLPPPIGIWPISYHWLVIIIPFIIMLTYIANWTIKKYKHAQYQKKALDALSLIYENTDYSSTDKFAYMSKLLKQLILPSVSRQTVAKLHGDKWFEYLNQHYQNHFIEQHDAICIAPFSKHTANDIEPYYRAIRLWIRRYL